MHPNRLFALGVAALATLLVAACGSSAPSSGSGRPAAASVKVGNPAAPVTLQEAGSSTMYPYLRELSSPLSQKYSNITLSPAAGGSGAGQSEAIAGTIDVGASDVYLSPAQFQSAPTILNIPISVSSLVVTFNLKGISSLNLTGPVVAGIYQGKVTKWNDPAIASLNPGVNLPDQTIVPIRRLDSAGDTFDLTEFLSSTSKAWANGPAEGLTVTWPAVTGEMAESGDPGMISGMSKTPGSIGYLGISYVPQGLQAGLGQAALRNRDGHFVKSDRTSVESAVAHGSAKLPRNLVGTLVNQAGAETYPIVTYDYLVVQSKQTDAAKALALRTFITWAVSSSGGATQGNLFAVGFQALPSTALPKIHAAINKIKASQ
ncbi:MAG: phosphate ABC transporter substrate-binding protein PstS [Candidatus Dormibacteraeota bacterium]|nr:phosphate ABC transporter substrate-binding protein PstS [Candidatus Dormibacteraeota bacterium]